MSDDIRRAALEEAAKVVEEGAQKLHSAHWPRAAWDAAKIHAAAIRALASTPRRPPQGALETLRENLTAAGTVVEELQRARQLSPEQLTTGFGGATPRQGETATKPCECGWCAGCARRYNEANFPASAAPLKEFTLAHFLESFQRAFYNGVRGRGTGK